MELTGRRPCDVLVVGAGLAAVTAAVSAAEAGASVVMASQGGTFSGSSFYPGTWGLGLIEPDGVSDRGDLEQTILEVGCGMAAPALVRTLVAGISSAAESLRQRGVVLRTAESGEKEYIPCFDHKHRKWNGIEFHSFRSVAGKRLEELPVEAMEGAELLELCQRDGRVVGAVLSVEGELVYQPATAVILACGGFSGLFQHHLTTPDVLGTGHALALRAGARLVNMEFMQMMPGYLAPAYQTVFNEKVFRFTQLTDAAGANILGHLPNREEVLGIRSTHGPFTCRLPSRQVDLAICRHGQVRAAYSEELKGNPPAFVRVYFDWLQREKGVDWNQPFDLAIFSHASNGGIRISADTGTGVEGLYACGEVTGGMHGADRLGGLSTANALVFGQIAGRQAAARSPVPLPGRWSIDGVEVEHVEERTRELLALMSRHAMVERSRQGLEKLRAFLGESFRSARRPAASVPALVRSHRFLARLETACAVADAALLRRESRGSHLRVDFPEMEKAAAPAEQKEVSIWK